ncbi:hypothetical protein C5C03_00545 [Clavibacter michiganensis]|uniref:histone-like nucleoid-structuring protein Lsr2 n=1 Tax=Clavibacter michiganensis TaxID=28447 RepID=UPI000CE847A4|nr:Lsr2 family protein [Clavibacter michiganensis]PPF91344.1 hypothetical protein C5C03_00545 [Clavibacter michiganensis]PPF99386.1 hypothetical protein C5C05_02345 [Clavibacter michiganensis]
MAENREIRVFDDIDGSLLDDLRPGETLEFGIDGARYEIDLSIAHATALRLTLEPYVDAGRRTRADRSTNAPAVARAESHERITARAWLRENGYSVGERGRLAGVLLHVYREQHAARSERRPA